MSTEQQIALSTTRHGRIILHLACLGDKHFAWHLKGIWREVAKTRTA